MKKKVALLKRRFDSYGGLEKYTHRIAQAFVAKGCEVHVLTAKSEKELTTTSSIHIHRFDVDSILGFRTIDLFDKACQSWLDSNPMDVVLGLDRNRHQTHIRAGNGVHKTFLEKRALVESPLKKYSYAINPLHQLILDIEKKGFEDPSLKTLFTNSHFVKKQITSNFDVDPKKVTVVHNGVEWKEFTPSFSSWLEAKAKIAGSCKIDPSSFQFLFIGNGYQRKGLSEVLRGLALLPTTDFHLSVVGKEKNRAKYEQLAVSLGLENNVTFFGPQKSITPFYQLADAVLIPSLYDPFANVTVEALAMGCYVVSSAFNGGIEVLKDYSGTVIQNLTDPDSMKEALLDALDNPKTWIRSQNIRNSVQYLDFPNQLEAIVTPCING